MLRSGHGRTSASSAPSTSDEAATAPQSRAESIAAQRTLPPVDDEADFIAAARADPALAVLEGVHALKHALRFGAEVLRIAPPTRTRCSRSRRRSRPTSSCAAGSSAAPLGLGRAAPHRRAAVARRPPSPGRAPAAAASCCSRTRATSATSAPRCASRPRRGAAALLTTGAADPGIPRRCAARPGCTTRCPVARVDGAARRPAADRAAPGRGGARRAPAGRHARLRHGARRAERGAAGPRRRARARSRCARASRASTSPPPSRWRSTASGAASPSARSSTTGAMPTDS